MLPTRRVLDANLEFLKVTTIVSCNDKRESEEGCVGKKQKVKAYIQTRRVPIKHAREIQLLHLFF